jgi:hypothetical protein
MKFNAKPRPKRDAKAWAEAFYDELSICATVDLVIFMYESPNRSR